MSIRYEEIPMQFHPRAFSAFGADLVTNDNVAIAELVKNSYDAFAYDVIVSISDDTIEIIDDGLGMTADIIRNAWAVIATPYKKKAPIVERDGYSRRVSGNKGLGRFSAARLGRYLTIISKSESEECIKAEIDWENFLNSNNMSDCRMQLTVEDSMPECLENGTGTIIIISGLYRKWCEEDVKDLQNSLSRLLSPFGNIEKFKISLNFDSYTSPVEIKPHDFIQHPTYLIKGSVDENGQIDWFYKYAPKNKVECERSGYITWKDSWKGFEAPHIFGESARPYTAGPFEFDIRAWDLDSSSVADVSEAFDIRKKEIRKSISQYKGLSVYRDNVLVLPKSDASKDWLGMDVRRVSFIGKRLSTSQIIGMVNISSEMNPEIKDTTDREKLVDTTEYSQFCRIIETIIVTLENQRYLEKKPEGKSPRGLNELLAPLSSSELAARVEEDLTNGKSSEEIVETVKDYAQKNEGTLQELNERLKYYAQTASLGSVAIVILHEILTGMTVMKRFIDRVKEKYDNADDKTIEYLHDSEDHHARLVDVAKSFAPLYRKNLRNEQYECDLKDTVEKCVRLIKNRKDAKRINILVDVDEGIIVPVVPGELQTVIINLLDNAVFWVNYAKPDNKEIQIKESIFNNRVKIEVSDTGVGINQEDAYRIFEPGVTSKPHGIGMGLVIVTEILNNYDCKIATVIPGKLGGATFEFDLPMR